MNKEFWKGTAAGVAITLCIGGGMYAGMHVVRRDYVVYDRKSEEKLCSLEYMIDNLYLGEVNDEELKDGLCAGLIYGLGDVYSKYYTAEEYQSEMASNQGEYVGIGVTIMKNEDGGIQIVKCYEGGPADAAGVQEGDIISAIDGKDVMDASAEDVTDMIREHEGSNVVLTVHREGEEELEISVEISNVELPSVFGEMLEEKTGYIRISSFANATVKQYQSKFEDLKEQGMERLIVDLRDNPGGLMTSVCEILRQILPEGLIVYTEDKNGNRTEETCDGENPLDMPLAVLINGNSASASEIFAGAVKDYGIGTLVGTTTYGKGVVQTLSQLQDGSAVKLTTARYYTPKGNVIQDKGVEPDVEVKIDPELLVKDEITHEEDNQLQEALRILEESR